MKPTILFVDDDDNILDGIKRSLFTHRREWRMEFCNDSIRALQMVAANKYNVIVTDLKMPNMDGIALLERVYIVSPETSRIILSGHIVEKEIAQSINLSHRFLSKPCAKEKLIQTIRSAISTREDDGCDATGIESESSDDSQSSRSCALDKLIAPLKSLPVTPAIYTPLIELLQDEDVSPKDVAKLIEQDAGISAQILRVANSSYFSLRQEVDSLTQAITLIGIRRIRGLVLSLNIGDELIEAAGDSSFISDCWEHSLRVAQNARLILEMESASSEQQDLAFLGGILHDVGKMVLYMANPAFYEDVNVEELVPKKEIDFFGFTHEHVGAALARLWGLPQEIHNIIANHHKPETMLNFDSLSVVYLADQVDQLQLSGSMNDEFLSEEAEQLLDGLNLKDRWGLWISAIKDKGLISSQEEKA